MKLLAKNKRASFDYDIAEKLIAGLVLTGAEVKSTKSGHASLKGSFVAIKDGEAYLTNAHITPYNMAGNQSQLEPTRTRKLLLHRRQLNQLINSKTAGLSIVPVALLENKRLIKLEIGLGKGKKKFDKRQAIKQRETDREARRLVS